MSAQLRDQHKVIASNTNPTTAQLEIKLGCHMSKGLKAGMEISKNFGIMSTSIHIYDDQRVKLSPYNVYTTPRAMQNNRFKHRPKNTLIRN